LIVSINQPAYLPWLGYFDRINRSDIHIVLDHVQFEKNSVINRNKIRTQNSWSWLTVPLKTKSKYGNLDIRNIEIQNTLQWKKKHLKTIQSNYSKCEYFKDYAPFFQKVYTTEWVKLIDFINFINKHFLKVLGIKTKIISSYELNPKKAKSDLILELCQKVEAHEYISGPFGRDYLDLQSFKNAGISVHFHDYSHPVYAQKFKGFESNMSIIDLLLNHGKDSLKILKNE
jgi:hypothetical protein